jgi:hypothetical protein
MAVRRILYRGPQAIALLRWPEPHTLDECLEFRDTSAAVDFLRTFMGDPVSMMSLRDVLAEELGSIDIVGWQDAEVVDLLAWRVVSGQIKLVPQVATRPPLIAAGKAGQAVAPAATEEPRAATLAPQPAPQPALSWIKFQVLDDETGQPVQGVGLKVKLPTGTVKEYMTDANGMVQIDDLPSGACDIEKMLDSDALEVVDIA